MKTLTDYPDDHPGYDRLIADLRKEPYRTFDELSEDEQTAVCIAFGNYMVPRIGNIVTTQQLDYRVGAKVQRAWHDFWDREIRGIAPDPLPEPTQPTDAEIVAAESKDPEPFELM